MLVGAKRPDRSRCEEIPFVGFFEKFATLLYGHPHIDPSGLDIFGNATFEWLSYHGKSIPVQKSADSSVNDLPPLFVRSVSVALERARLQHGFTELGDWVRNLYLNLREQFT